MYFNGLLRNKDIYKIEKSHLGYNNFSRETVGFLYCGFFFFFFFLIQ